MKIFAKKKKGFTPLNSRKANLTGFTLIELLVVIAIIGILASIVLVSLSGAKNRAKDANIIADMGQMRSASEVFYGNQTPSTYTGTCSSPDVLTLWSDIGAQGGTATSCQEQTGTNAGKSYCMKSKMNSGAYWCVDSSLRSKQYPSTFSGCTACAGVACICE